MTTAIQKASAIEAVVAAGDLSKISPDQRVAYYREVCASIGLNELTQPFQYITLNGKLTLYATKACTEQLRRLYGVSIGELEGKEVNGVYLVTARGRDNHGRTDAATGAVPIKGLSGDALANALMKAETKAKRRLTLSMCGLGFLDESEIETIPNASTATVSVVHGFTPQPSREPERPALPEPEPQPEPQRDATASLIDWRDEKGIPDGARERSGVVKAITSKSGEKNGKPWTRYGIKVAFGKDEMWLNTFSETAAAVAERLKDEKVFVHYTETERGANLHAIAADEIPF